MKGTQRCKEETTTTKDSTVYVGLDLGDNYSHLAILDRDGELVEAARLPSTPTAFQRRFRQLHRSRVAIEAGSHSRWSSQIIEKLGHEVLVANASELRAIYTNPRKNDRADPETSARLVRVDPALLSPIRHRSAQAHLAVIRSRDVLVRSRTRLPITCGVRSKRPARACPPVQQVTSCGDCGGQKAGHSAPPSLEKRRLL